MIRLGDRILFSSRDSLAQIKEKLDQVQSWSISTFAHEHRIECYGAVSYDRWGGSLYGYFDGITLHFTIEGRNADTGRSCYRVTYEFSEQFRVASNDKEATQSAAYPEGERVKELIARLGGDLLDDQD